jgi:riboflavin synthase
MFTGIIEERGTIAEWSAGREGAALAVRAPALAASLEPGDSIAVNGVCLTAVRADAASFACDLSSETLSRSTFAAARLGLDVNLERPLEVGGRVGGHFVLGHVDGVGTLEGRQPSGDGAVMRFRFPAELARYLVWKGSIAVDGISLTIAALEREAFSVAVIPHTLEVTTLGSIAPGDSVNLEVDVLGKYCERFFELGLVPDRPSASTLTLDYLREQGF